MHVTTIRVEDSLMDNIRYLAEKQNSEPHSIMVEYLQKAIDEEMERIRFIEEGEREYQKMLADPSYGLTMEQARIRLGLTDD